MMPSTTMALGWLILLPFAGGVFSWFAGRRSAQASRWIAAAALLADLVLAASIVRTYPALTGTPAGPADTPAFYHEWLPQFGIGFNLALDGLSLLMVLLTLFIGIICVIISRSEIRHRIGLFHMNLLMATAGILGVFLARDLFLFYFFWELMIVPMYFLIAVWGHENRRYASLKFFIFTQLSGMLMLIAIVGLYFAHGGNTGIYTFDYRQLLGAKIPPAVSIWLMLGFFAAFAVKLPVFLFHTWLPDAHTEAPTAGSVMLAGLLLKTGAYGMIRFMVPLFPESVAAFYYVGAGLAVAGILYGAFMAFSQSDVKRLVAYSSISHMGFVLLGIFTWNEIALQGAVVQMLCHGLSTGGLFILVGAIQERLHTRDIRSMGGLWSSMPRLGGIGMVLAMASLGLPGLGNFVGEFLVLIGAYGKSRLIAGLAALGLVAAAIYSLRFIQGVFHGKVGEREGHSDAGSVEMLVLSALTAALIFIGVYPQPVLDAAKPALRKLTAIAGAQQQPVAADIKDMSAEETGAGK